MNKQVSAQAADRPYVSTGHLPAPDLVETLVAEAHAKFKSTSDGENSQVYPALAKVPPDLFGICVVETNGIIHAAGDTDHEFSIMSVSKPFLFALICQLLGAEDARKKLGANATGFAFNSVAGIERTSDGRTNPMVNAGAIATADLINGRDFPERLERLLRMFNRYCGRDVYIDNGVFLSERATGHRNRAMGHLMLNFGMVSSRVEETLELYFQQCSVLVNSHDLAVMGATLANGGVNPITKERAIKSEHVKDLLASMLSCGMYDYAGEWAFRVGIPAKSGVAGGLVGVIPGQFGIGVFSPRLDSKGNTVRGIKVFQELSERFGLHVFESGFQGESLKDLMQPKRNG